MNPRRLPILFVTTLVSILAQNASAQVVYVDDTATGANDGSSWANAFVDLHAGLNGATPGASIWVAEGLYRPAPPGGSTSVRYVVNAGVRVYGSFAGFETSTDQRDIAAHPSVLSGDLLGDDAPGFVNRGDNTAQIVEVTDGNADTIFDGFVVRGSNVITSNPTLSGGVGLYGNSALVQHCWFEDNSTTTYGGGLFAAGGNPRAFDCTFIGNRSLQDGGGVDFESGGTLVRCRILGNQAQNEGGGVFMFGQGYLYDCEIVGNRASNTGGLVCMYGTARMRGCNLVGNVRTSSGSGGAAGAALGSSGVFVNSIAFGNSGGSGSGSQEQLQTIQWIVIHHSIVQGTAGSVDPRFANRLGPDGIQGTPDDDLRLLPGSPCIDAGDNTSLLAGTVTDVAGLRRLADDPGTPDTGIGTAPIVDIGAHEYQPCAGPTSFCVTSPNSVGPGATMGSSGSAKLYANDLVLTADGCPPSTFGLFFHGDQTQQIPFGNGVRCIGGNVLRVGIVPVNAMGSASLSFDASASALPIPPGTRRYFQFWYRNTMAGGAGFNLSDGMSVRFCP